MIDPFLKGLITSDEKWIVYNNVNRKRSWAMMQDDPTQATFLVARQKLLDVLSHPPYSPDLAPSD